MKFNPDIHHRRSIRLRGYDYSLAGAYFVTICTQNREYLFGEIVDGKMILNDAGKMIETWWQKIPDKFSTIQMDLHTVMPNHFHSIIAIVGADPCVCPDKKGTNEGAHMGAPLQKIIQWFKTMTTNEYIDGVAKYNWSRFNGKFWQRNYYEHIIRSEPELHKVCEYIVNNPLNWETDENFKN